jgi:hypothetical protein
MATTQVKEMTDNQLCWELMDWCRISRNEGGLHGEERKHFQAICKEVSDRKLLKYTELHRPAF